MGVPEMLQKADGDLVRRQNRSLVLDCLRQHGPMARVELGQITGLSPASMTAITTQMLNEGLLTVADEANVISARARRGRPQTKLALNPCAAIVLAVSISADGASIAAADFSGTMFNQQQLLLNTFNADAATFARQLAEALQNYAAAAKIDLGKVNRISIAVQGVTDTNKGTIAWSPAFETRDIGIVQPLERLLGIPCSIANNVNRIADGLLNEDRSKYATATAVIFLGHGVGLGLILDGRVFEGASGRASEFGHMPHDPKGPLCRCGLPGCLEAYSADYGIMRMATGEFADIRTPISPETMAGLQRDAENGVARARNAYEKAGEVLGIGLARMVALINPRYVVFTGPGVLAFHLMQESMQAALTASLVPDLLQDVELEVLADDRDLIITGTLAEALHFLDRDVFASGGQSDAEDSYSESA